MTCTGNSSSRCAKFSRRSGFCLEKVPLSNDARHSFFHSLFKKKKDSISASKDSATSPSNILSLPGNRHRRKSNPSSSTSPRKIIHRNYQRRKKLPNL